MSKDNGNSAVVDVELKPKRTREKDIYQILKKEEQRPGFLYNTYAVVETDRELADTADAKKYIRDKQLEGKFTIVAVKEEVSAKVVTEKRCVIE